MITILFLLSAGLNIYLFSLIRQQNNALNLSSGINAGNMATISRLKRDADKEKRDRRPTPIIKKQTILFG
jgi:hypothetical protein